MIHEVPVILSYCNWYSLSSQTLLSMKVFSLCSPVRSSTAWAYASMYYRVLARIRLTVRTYLCTWIDIDLMWFNSDQMCQASHSIFGPSVQSPPAAAPGQMDIVLQSRIAVLQTSGVEVYSTGRARNVVFDQFLQLQPESVPGSAVPVMYASVLNRPSSILTSAS